MKKKHKPQAVITIEQLRELEPIASLSTERLEELIPLVYVEQLVIGGNLFREGDIDNQTLYLLKGDVQLASSDGNIYKTLTGGSKEGRYPLDDSQPRQATCSALTRVDVLQIDNSVLDYMMMWDQLAVSESMATTEHKKETEINARPEAAKKSPPETPPEASQQPSVTADGNPTDKIKQADSTAPKVAEKPETAAVLPEKKSIQTTNAPVVDIEEAERVQNSEPRKEAEISEASIAEPSIDYASPVEKISADASPENQPEVVSEAVDAPTDETGEENDRSWIRKMRHIMAFKSMPPANIKQLLECMESIEVKQGETIVEQGSPGDYYYVLTEGKAKVTRLVELATLEPGLSFGEEALISDDIRNASITMDTDGVVMRLSKKDFSHLLQEPLLHRLSPGDARIHIAKGAKWLDVRHAREYQHSHLADSVNIPLHELRNRLDELVLDVPIICYCSTGRRSAAAAFLLAQKGFKASVLNGGVRVMAQDLKRVE